MEYKNIVMGTFLARPNRFIAHVEIDGVTHIAHVKNTGRCKELLVCGAKVYLQECDSEKRKTKYDLICVYKGDTLINMDSQVPNKVFEQWAVANLDLASIKREVTYKNSRFDFYIETKIEKIFVEVKGVTLERDGVAMFPDAPTLRGLKHIKELQDAVVNGYTAWIVFVISLKGVSHFTPNTVTHKEFALALKQAQSAGVKVFAYDCIISPNTINIDQEIKCII